MIEVDGGQQSGSGTIVRLATAFAALQRRPLHLFNARAKRAKPGLRPQHVTAVRACAELCGGSADGLAVGSREFTFVPGTAIPGGMLSWDIGTAGSATMLALGILPVACFANAPVTARITGGVFQDFAPSPHHMQHVLAALLSRMGVAAELRVIRPGYVPGGAGVIELRVRPVRRCLAALVLEEQGSLGEIRGVAIASHLDERRVSERMANACEARLAEAHLVCHIERTHDSLASQPGASLAVWAQTSTGCVLGADRAGALRRSAESIGHFVADHFLADLGTGATVDRHAADQVVPFAALAAGRSHCIVPNRTEHLETNLWLARQFGARTSYENRRVEIDGIGLTRATN